MILIFGQYPIEAYQSILSNSKFGAQFAADALQWSIITGFEENNIIPKIINLPYIGSFPQRYSKLFYQPISLCYTINNNPYTSYKFCNLSLYKMLSRYFVTRRTLFNNFKSQSNDEIIIIYSVSTPFLKAALNFKRKFPTTKICVIVADLPEYMSDNKNIFYKILKYIDGKNIYKYLKNVDAFVLLSENMKEKLPINDKPYTIVEGIFNVNDEDLQVIDDENETKKIMYSGTLARRYGIMNLVNAFTQIKNDNYRLIICGDGDTKDDIISIAKKDIRIQYLGSLKRDEVLRLQKKSSLLVNPRTPEGEFTKYSFPSKTMEYLASGTPTLLYKLPGIPEEYYNYCYTIDKLGVNELSFRIEEIIEKSNIELKKHGEEARNFILKNKNPKVQCKKIINMINLMKIF